MRKQNQIMKQLQQEEAPKRLQAMVGMRAHHKSKHNAPQTPQRVPQNLSTSQIITKANRGALNIRPFDSPFTTDVRRKMSLTDPHKITKMTNDTKTKYESYSAEWANPKKLKRGPIARIWVSSAEARAAHLVGYNVGELGSYYLFGDAETDLGHTMTPTNALMIHLAFEEALDGGRIIIVPASKDDVDPETNEKVDVDDKEPFKVIVLDQQLLQDNKGSFALGGGGGVKVCHLDGRILKFLNNNRPKKRYLWFLAIINIARRSCHQVPGWQKDTARLGSELWASPGEYLRKSTIYAIMHSIGFDPNPEKTLGPGPTLKGSPGVTETCKEVVGRVAMQLSPPSEARKAGKGASLERLRNRAGFTESGSSGRTPNNFEGFQAQQEDEEEDDTRLEYTLQEEE